MKKVFQIVLCLVLILSLSGCGSSGTAGGKTPTQSSTVRDVLDAGMAEADATPAPEATPVPASATAPGRTRRSPSISR